MAPKKGGGGVAPFQRAAPVLAVCDGKRAPGLAGRELVAALLAELDRRHGRIALRETYALLFPDGCPEPVLVNDRFAEENGVCLENEFRTYCQRAAWQGNIWHDTAEVDELAPCGKRLSPQRFLS